MKKILFILWCISMFGAARLQAADSASRVGFQMEGQITVTANKYAAFLSIGGATFKMNFDHFTLALITMPIIKFSEDPVKPFVSPGFGAGLQLCLLKDRRFILSAPFYYNNANNKWQFTAGIGYVFTKPKKS